MFLNNMSKRERAIALATLSILAAAIIYNFILDPVLHQWRTLSAAAESKKKMLKSDLKMAREAKTLEANTRSSRNISGAPRAKRRR